MAEALTPGAIEACIPRRMSIQVMAILDMDIPAMVTRTVLPLVSMAAGDRLWRQT